MSNAVFNWHVVFLCRWNNSCRLPQLRPHNVIERVVECCGDRCDEKMQDEF